MLGINTSRETKNVVLLSILSLIEGLQFIILIGLIMIFGPYLTNLSEVDWSQINFAIKPIREILLYRVLVFSALMIFSLLVYHFKEKLQSKEFTASLMKFVKIEGLFTGIVLYSIIKLAMFQFNNVFKFFFVFSICLLIINKVLFKLLMRIYCALLIWFEDRRLANISRIVIDCLVPIFLFCSIFIPDIEGLNARIFSVDKLYHLDSLIIAPGWAHLKGLVLNVDVISIYGVGLPITISRLAQMIGGFGYENVLLVMLCLVIVYYVIFYSFLRYWTKSILISLIGIILYLKLQMFNNDPLIVMYPGRSAFRYMFDIPFMMFILLHCRYGKKYFILCSSVITGMALSYITDSGVYLLITLYAYLFLNFMFEDNRRRMFSSKKDIVWVLSYALLPFFVGVFMLWVFVGNNVFTYKYWYNVLLIIKELPANGAVAFAYNVGNAKYMLFFMSCVIPIAYLLTMIVQAGMKFLKKTEDENLFVITLCVYGLCLYHYFVWRSILSNFYVVCGPFILILCFWLREYSKRIDVKRSRSILLTILLFSAIFLFTDNNFVNCNNIFNLSGANSNSVKKFMNEQLDVQYDIEVIERLTSEDDRVCVISSFETMMLVKADRKPYFYQFPQLTSEFLRNTVQAYGGTNFFRGDKDKYGMKRVKEKFGRTLPEYIFVEKKITAKLGNLKFYFEPGFFLTTIFDTLSKHYVPVNEQTRYLFVFKRK